MVRLLAASELESQAFIQTHMYLALCRQNLQMTDNNDHFELHSSVPYSGRVSK